MSAQHEPPWGRCAGLRDRLRDRAMSFGVAAEPATDLSGGHYYWPPFSLLLGTLHAAASLLVFENGTAAFDLVRAGHL